MSWELAIIGGGPAGVAAMLWAKSFGLDACLVECRNEVGGQLHFIRFHPREFPGVAEGMGADIARAFRAQLRDAAADVVASQEATHIERRGDELLVRTAAEVTIAARALLIATGLRRRRLEVTGEAELTDLGVSYSARRDRDRMAGGDVVVVGGGDGAYENALLLTEVGCRVLLLVRAEPRARPEFRQRVAAEPRIRVLSNARVLAFRGDASLESVQVFHDGITFDHPVRGAVIKIGMIPNSEWCSSVERDADGYVRVDGRGRTSMAGIWAAGDVARPLFPSLAAAIGSAAIAVADIRVALRGV